MITEKITLENLSNSSVIIHISYSNTIWHQQVDSPIPDTYDLFINNSASRELLAKKLDARNYEILLEAWGDGPTINTPDVSEVNISNLQGAVGDVITEVNSHAVSIGFLTQNKLGFKDFDNNAQDKYIYATTKSGDVYTETNPIATNVFNPDIIYKIKIATNALGDNQPEQFGYLTQSTVYTVDNVEKVTEMLITDQGVIYSREAIYDTTGVTKFPVFTKSIPTFAEFVSLKNKVDNFETLLTDLSNSLDTIISELQN